MIIDAHAHIFPDKIAANAVIGIQKFYDIPIPYDGTVQGLFRIGDEAGVDRFIVQSVATTASQVTSINDFIARETVLHPQRLIGFMTLHPETPNPSREIERCIALGLKGVKLHPDFQTFYIDDPAVFPVYDAIQGRLPLLIHMGDNRYSYSNPCRLAKVLEQFPHLQVIAAHMGGWSQWQEAAEALQNKNLWVDTSSSMAWLTPEQMTALIRLYGSERVLFGTDYPMWAPKEELAMLRKLPLTDEELENILGRNVLRLLRLPE